MARTPTSTAVVDPIENNGLRFMNSQWNDSISNGAPFHINWDTSLHGVESDLGVFKVSYLEEGIIAYKLAIDLTDIVEDRFAKWTPEDLAEDLYVFWLKTIGEESERWAISPPWIPKAPPPHGFRWVTPIGIPIAVIMGIYIISVTTCFFYRRKKKTRQRQELHERQRRERRAMLAAREQQVQQHLHEQSLLDPAGERHPSVSSVDTAQTLTEDEVQKPEVALLMETPPRTSCARRPSQPELFIDTFQARRPSRPDLYPEGSPTKRPPHADLYLETRPSRRPSRAELYSEVSPTRSGPLRQELYIDALPATEVGKAL